MIRGGAGKDRSGQSSAESALFFLVVVGLI